MEPRYLGDGVYASWVDGRIMLSCGSHKREDAEVTIWLEPEVARALHVYIRDAAKEYRW